MRFSILFLMLASWTFAGSPAAASAGFTAIDEASVRGVPEADPVEAGRWIGPDGETLPFRDEAELLEFLRTAPIVWEERLAKGITRSHKVLLERDGVRAHAIFRRTSANRPGYRRPNSRINVGFRDSCFFEPAAYELGRLLGIRNIPPVVVRQHGGKEGTLQLWVENAFDEQARLERELQPPEPDHWLRQHRVRVVFDALIHNIDRNQGNLLIDPDWNLWLIDHTRAFLALPDLPGRRLVMVRSSMA